MENETEPPWYRKCIEYLRNRNRIGPGKVELPDCDFFLVESRRTLRILRPSLKSGRFYESSDRERPESVNDNFFSRWSRRPHPSGNCRCSFRQSSGLSTTEEQIISAEINRIRTSLCEAKTGEDIAEIEKRVSLTLENLRVTNRDDKKIFDKPREANDDQVAVKNKIVRDLESYINDLLEEIMSDTIKFISESGNSLGRKCRSAENIADKCREPRIERNSETRIDTFEINFAFPDEKTEITDFKSASSGYVNPAFDGSTQEPDALNFYLRRQLGTEIILEQFDCIDSGINSVETVELQPEQEPSLEESLLEIIDAKLGRTPASKSWEHLEEFGQCGKHRNENSEEIGENGKNEENGKTEENEKSEENQENGKSEENSEKDVRKERENGRVKSNEFYTEREETPQSTEKKTSATKKTETLEKSTNTLDTVDSIPEDFRELEDLVDDQSFERLRLEFKESTSTPKAKTKRVKILKEKLINRLNTSSKNKSSKNSKNSLKNSPNLLLELKDCKKNWTDFEVTSDSSCQDPSDFVVFRRNRKPTIVFIHGFGSSAEIFAHQLEYFSNLGYPCIAPDLLGHGMSSAPNRSRDYHFEKLLHDLDLVLHHYAFKPEQKCVLVAHNYGCSFATALACKYESSIHQLVLISGGGPTPLAPPSNETARHCCLRAMLTPFLVCGLHRDILYSARGRQHPYCGFEPEEQWPSHMKYVLKGMAWPEGDYVFHRRICTPTLLIHGLRDNKVSLVQECQMERTMIKAFLEALPTAGHIPMTDCPNQINHMIHCFIDLWKNKRW